MRILTWLTVIYAGVLVVALAVALSTIAALLWKISGVLAAVQRALSEVAADTAPLQPQLSGVAEAVDATKESLRAAHDDLARGVACVDARAGHVMAPGR